MITLCRQTQNQARHPLFKTLAAFGAKLVALHLLESPDLKKHGIGYPVAGSHTVKKRKAAERWRELPSPPDPLSNDKLLLTGSQDFPAARSLGRGGEPELETVALPSVLGVTPTGNADASASPLPSEERTHSCSLSCRQLRASPLPKEPKRLAGRGAGGEGTPIGGPPFRPGFRSDASASPRPREGRTAGKSCEPLSRSLSLDRGWG